MKDIEIEKAARKYCDETGSMYFEYTDASNELIDAFRAGVRFMQEQAQKENEALKAKLEKAREGLRVYANAGICAEYGNVCEDQGVAVETLAELGE